MSSNINPTNINGAYPIAGQDNDSQGFRDNFTNIRTNLTHAKTELEDLQSKVVLKAQLNGGNPVDNSFTGLLMTGAQTKAFTESIIDHGTKTSSVVLDFTMGDLQKVTVGGPLSVEFTNWPAAGVYATIRAWFVSPTSSSAPMDPITFPAAVRAGVNAVFGLDASGSAPILTPTRTGNYFIEFGTIDGGITVSAVLLFSPESADEFVLNSIDNNMKGHVLSNYAASSITHTFTSPAALIDLSVADMHRVVATQSLVLAFDNWPSTGYATTRLWVTISNVSHTIAFPAAVSVGLDKVPGVTGQILTPTAGNYLFEFSSMDAGATILVVPLITP